VGKLAKLTRPPEGASRKEAREYIAAIARALDEIGVARGEEFVLANAAALTAPPEGPAAEDPAADGLGGFTADSDTSRQAAIDNYPRSGSQRHRILLCIIAAGHDVGRTAHEVAKETGIYYGSVTPRIGELKRGGWIEASEWTRRSEHDSEAEVLLATDKALAHVAKEAA
jgi:hypothetical protein